MKTPRFSAVDDRHAKSASRNQKIFLGLLLAMVMLSFDFCGFANAENLTSSMVMAKNILPILKRYRNNLVDFEDFLSKKEGIQIFKPIRIGQDFNKLPALPDQDLLDSLQSQQGVAGSPAFHLEWIRTKHIGGLYYTVGSGMCQYWIMFQSDALHAIPVDSPDIFQQYVCGNDGGGFGHEAFIAVIDNQVVAIKDGVEQTDDGTLTFRVYLQVWDGASWDQPAEEDIPVSLKN